MQRLFLLIATTCGCNLITGASSLRECESEAECGSLTTSGAGGTTSSSTTSSSMGGSPTVIEIEEIGTGRYSTCVTLLPDRTAWCWGQHTGNGTADTHTTPVAVTTPSGGVTQLVHGLSHHCALGSAGEVYCWGNNDFGQLGTGDNVARVEPTLVAGTLPVIVRLSTAGMHTCALSEDSPPRSFCWGWNAYGQLGTGDTLDRNAPTEIDTGVSGAIVHQGAGFAYTCAVTDLGAVWCWGANEHGQLGLDPMTDIYPSPVPVTGLPELERIYPGYQHTCGRTAIDRKLVCWGNNESGQLGDGGTSSRHAAQEVPEITRVDVAYPGKRHTCVLDSGTAEEGILWCWGNNDHGQITEMAMKPQLDPLQIGTGITRVAGKASEHICFGQVEGVSCAGLNDAGQLGDGTYESNGTPQAVQF